jgi:cell division protein FtsQ
MVSPAALHDTEFYISDKIPDVEALPFQPGVHRLAAEKRSRVKSTRLQEQKREQDGEQESVRPKRFWLVCFAAGVLVLAGYVTFAALPSWLDQWCRIEQVSVEGRFDQLNRAAFSQGIASSTTGGFFHINLNAVQEAALAFPWVESVSVRRVWPDKLIVHVTEREAVAYWQDKGLISAKGDLFVPEQFKLSGALVGLSGPDGTEKMVFDFFQSVRPILDSLGLTLATLQLDARGGWRFTTENNLVVELGRQNIEQRLDRFVHHYLKVAGSSENPVKSIDMRYGNGFAVAWVDQAQGNQMAQRIH